MRHQHYIFVTLFFLLPFITYGQVLLDHDQKLLQDYNWIFDTNVKHACNQPNKTAVIETHVDKCNFINDFSMFPNPASDIVQIDFSGRKASTKVFISNLNGQLIYSKNLEDFSGQENLSVQLQSYPAGIYVITIAQNDETFIRKLVIE
jgi:hypothetical protein